MATDLLADGRAEDVVQMIDPLLEPVEAPAASTGQIMLRTLRARVEIVHRDNIERALDFLPAPAGVSELCTCVRAEVLLWRGWAHARRHADSGEAARALRFLENAEDLFASIHDPSGRCWAMLGRAQAFFALDEYALMRHALRTAEPLADQLNDVQLGRWRHELHIPALRFEGRYDEAERHVDALRALGERWNNRRIRGYAAAHAAAIQYDLGERPDRIIQTAETAEALLRQVDPRAHYPLLAAYHAHIGALLRRGHWSDARSVIDEAEDAVREDAGDQAHLQTLRARLALRRGSLGRADALLEDLVDRAHHLPHGLQRSHVALLQGEVLARKDDLDEAATWIQRAYRNAQETGHRGNQLRTLLTLARTDAARGNVEAAHAHLDAADEYDDYFSVLPFAVSRFAAEGTVAQATGQEEEAMELYRHALSTATMMHDRYRTASLQLALAQVEDEDRAYAFAADARSTFEALEAHEEEKVATALMDGVAPTKRNGARNRDPSPFPATATLGNTLARASLSLPLAAKTWGEAIAQRLPGRWIGVYRRSSDGIASVMYERGTRPEGVHPPRTSSDANGAKQARWISLQDCSPTLLVGIETKPEADEDAWEKAREQLQRWTPLVRLAVERARLHQDRSASTSPPSEAIPIDGFVAESESMKAVADSARRIQTSHSPVLITGEPGVGKRLLARVVHSTSKRAEGPRVHVPCAGMQQEPVADRLFGTTREDGSLSPGAVHEADGGTLVIEDIDALPMSAQSTLLHLLESGQVVPEGGTETHPVDVRVLATTTERLAEQVRNDHFRPALRERLSVLSLHMPPLRERRADIPLLVRHFLEVLPPEGTAMASITQPAMEALLRYDWPGNVRQLRNELERILVRATSEPAPTIDRDVLLDQIVKEAQSEPPPTDDLDAILHPNQSLSDVLSRTETAVIERVLRACDGQVTASAEVLGLSRQGLYKKMKRLGIDASSYQSEPEPAGPSS